MNEVCLMWRNPASSVTDECIFSRQQPTYETAKHHQNAPRRERFALSRQECRVLRLWTNLSSCVPVSPKILTIHRNSQNCVRKCVTLNQECSKIKHLFWLFKTLICHWSKKITFVQDLPTLPETVSTNSSQSYTRRAKSPHSCKTNRLMRFLGFF